LSVVFRIWRHVLLLWRNLMKVPNLVWLTKHDIDFHNERRWHAEQKLEDDVKYIKFELYEALVTDLAADLAVAETYIEELEKKI
jgi:hypothetical protein